MGSFVDFLGRNIWAPILIATGIAVFLLIILWLICRHRRRNQFNYLGLEADRSLIKKWDEEKRIQKMAERDAVLLNCYYYLKDSKTYGFIDHLPDIGSRINKQWFLVRDSQQGIDAVLTMVPWNTQCVISFTKSTKKTLKELFSLLQHPYLFPVMDVDFVIEHNLVMFIHPYRSTGSLKDIIYGSRPQSSWQQKYQAKGKSLSLTQIRNYGRQVLEALLYLRDKGLPVCDHLHSGNVFIVNGTSKLSAFENSLLGWKSRLDPLLKKLCKDSHSHIDVIQFGHLLYEMLAGYELTTAEPKKEKLVNFKNTPVVEVINFIFFPESEIYPSLDELVSHPFFKGGDISGLQKYNPGPVRFGSNVKQLLRLYRDRKDDIIRKRRPSTKKAKPEESAAVPKERKLSKSKGKRLSIDKAEIVPAVQFSSKASSLPKSPPPPPKQPPPPPQLKRPPSSGSVPSKPPSVPGRAGLLSQIQKGTKLKRAATNDRSAPRV
ncbi:hypothetical protein ABFA07_002536 [Porites harrisoni]